MEMSWSKVRIPATIALLIVALLAVGRTVAGCGPDPREVGNSKAQVEADHAAALKRIQNMPGLSEADKKTILQHIGLAGGGSQGRGGGPPSGPPVTNP